MISSRQISLLKHSGSDLAFDDLTRQLYATDASVYQIEPVAVAFPRGPAQASALIQAARDVGLSLIPRGAGTGLVGGAIGDGLIIDFARHNRGITDLNLERESVRVGPGVVLDQLNAFLKPHGYCFGPDVATSSRATLGGMIGNNSSGSHVNVYGTTADHVLSLDLVLADGRLETIGPGQPGLSSEHDRIRRMISEHSREIAERMPAGILKRWPGYGLDRFVQHPSNFNYIFCGSEGTLGGLVSAELRIVRLPQQKGVGLIFFSTVAEAMQATVELLDLKPAAIEHIDRILFDQTRGQLPFQAARDLLELDTKPCESILIVEFFDAVDERLAELSKRSLGQRKRILKSAREMNLVWNLRKAGLSLLTGRKGPAKPVTCIEDTAVRPEQLPAYVAGLNSILDRLGLEACYYGHASTGLLHVRPVLDLHSADDLKKFRLVAVEVSALVRQFKGSLAAEHGVGIARTEFMEEQLGATLMEVLRRIKRIFDPHDLFNPGKLFDGGRYRVDRDLRAGAAYRLVLPFVPTLMFAAKDGSFLGNLEQCNGCGGCRKEAPTMCPTFMATGEEVMSTRGRANVIRAVLERRLGNGQLLASPELEGALSHCLSCKACTTECPSNVNLALLKAELQHARHEQVGMRLSERVLSRIDQIAHWSSAAPGLANGMLRKPWMRHVLETWFGLSARRPLPQFTNERFDTWFDQRRYRRPGWNREPKRGPVYLWDDTFVRYYEPHIGHAAVSVLEAAGFDVHLVRPRRCCGRPAFSQGDLDRAKGLGRHNLLLISSFRNDWPILFLEPSCYSMFVEDYRELGLANAETIRQRCYLFEQFVDRLLAREPDALRFHSAPQRIAIHAHCHAKALTNPGYMESLANRLPGRTATLLDTGCCGMAGAFGATTEKYDLSIQVAQPLIERVQQQIQGTVIVASGTSCRHQIKHLTPVAAKHMAEVLAAALQ